MSALQEGMRRSVGLQEPLLFPALAVHMCLEQPIYHVTLLFKWVSILTSSALYPDPPTF